MPPAPPTPPSALPASGFRLPTSAATPSALDLIDEAALRLRLAPLGTLGVYYAGSLPFILALLYFWTDMSRNADAPRDAPGAALAMAALFLAMKTAQAVFAARLRAQFARRTDAPWTFARWGRVARVQALLQPSGLFLLAAPTVVPILLTSGRAGVATQLFALGVGLVLTLPLAWVYAFYVNVTVLGDGDPSSASPPSARAVAVRAARHALRDPRGNHFVLLIVSLLGMFAWLNLVIATWVLPQLAKIFTGEENAFTRSGLHLFNSTFFAVTFGLVYLALDPLLRTVYALRCFYADAQTTGEDLTSGLRALPPPDAGATPRAVTLALLFTVTLLTSSASALPPSASALPPSASALPPSASALSPISYLLSPSPSASPSPLPASSFIFHPSSFPPPSPGVDTVSAPRLARSVEDVLRRREFAWRSPRTAAADTPDAPAGIGRFLADARAWLQRTMDRVSDFFRGIKAWLRRWWNPRPDPSELASSRDGLDPETLRRLIYALIVLVAGAVTLLLWRNWQTRRAAALAGQTLPAGPPAVPDLTDETLLASELPEDEWLALARGLLDRGERRLALRAFYLSTLSGLGTRGLLQVARHKSNRDYVHELLRRARDRAPLTDAFTRNVGRFERVWYGPHPADDTLLADFQADRALLLAE